MKVHPAVDGYLAGDESRPITDAAPTVAGESAREASGYPAAPGEGERVEDDEVTPVAETVEEDHLTVERARERVLEDERLRSDLTDDEAQLLLDWIMAVVDEAGQQGEPLEPVLDQVRGAGREINDLVGARDTLEPAVFATRLRLLAGLPEPGPRPFWRRWLAGDDAADGVARRARELDGPALMRAVVALLPLRPESEAST